MNVWGASALTIQELEAMVNNNDDPTYHLSLYTNRFYILAVCVSISNQRVEITQQLKQLTTVSARRFYHTLHHLTVMDPTWSLPEDIHQRYLKLFLHIDFAGFTHHHTMTMIGALIRKHWGPCPVWHNDNRPSDHEHHLFAHNMAELAQAKSQQTKEVPKWILDFAFDSLSLDPLPPASAVASCLKVIAIDLGCNLSNITDPNRRYVPSNPISIHHLTKS